MYTPPKAIRDRRRHKRWLTLRNGMYAAVALVAILVVASVLGEFHKPAAGEHGRLFSQRAKQQPVAVVTEAPPVVETPVTPEVKGADPLLLSAAVREQYLTVEDAAEPEQPQYVASSTAGDLPRLGGGTFVDAQDQVFEFRGSAPRKNRPGERIVIAGGADGVAIGIR